MPAQILLSTYQSRNSSPTDRATSFGILLVQVPLSTQLPNQEASLESNRTLLVAHARCIDASTSFVSVALRQSLAAVDGRALWPDLNRALLVEGGGAGVGRHPGGGGRGFFAAMLSSRWVLKARLLPGAAPLSALPSFRQLAQALDVARSLAATWRSPDPEGKALLALTLTHSFLLRSLEDCFGQAVAEWSLGRQHLQGGAERAAASSSSAPTTVGSVNEAWALLPAVMERMYEIDVAIGGGLAEPLKVGTWVNFRVCLCAIIAIYAMIHDP